MNRDELMAEFPTHRDRLVSALTRLVGPDAEDIANDTLLKALNAVEGFRGDANLGTWLHRIGTNLAYDQLRRKGRAPVSSAEEVALPDESIEEVDCLEQDQMSECVQQVLATLPSSQRQLLIQADVLEQTTPEIARDAGITPGNAKIRLHRARKSLQDALKDRCDFHHRDADVLCCTPKPRTD
ncbi:MAG TPA: RNA polymerase sigma factor [Rhodocyclaceae bacterium]|nr:RNA polymerase sigma factor [Rhodocyclaceae bacterium]